MIGSQMFDRGSGYIDEKSSKGRVQVKPRPSILQAVGFNANLPALLEAPDLKGRERHRLSMLR